MEEGKRKNHGGKEMKLTKAIKETLKVPMKAMMEFAKKSRDYRMVFLHCVSFLPAFVGLGFILISTIFYVLFVIPLSSYNWASFISGYNQTCTTVTVGFLLLVLGIVWAIFWESVVGKVEKQ